jgi:uncharacterized protein YjgD (DUF1641 family)
MNKTIREQLKGIVYQLQGHDSYLFMSRKERGVDIIMPTEELIKSGDEAIDKIVELIEREKENKWLETLHEASKRLSTYHQAQLTELMEWVEENKDAFGTTDDKGSPLRIEFVPTSKLVEKIKQLTSKES